MTSSDMTVARETFVGSTLISAVESCLISNHACDSASGNCARRRRANVRRWLRLPPSDLAVNPWTTQSTMYADSVATSNSGGRCPSAVQKVM